MRRAARPSYSMGQNDLAMTDPMRARYTRFTDAHRLYERLGYVRSPGTRELHDLSRSVEYHFAKALSVPTA